MFLGLLLISIVSFSQTKVGSYSSGSFTIDLSPSQKNLVFDSIVARLGLHSCTLDSVVINDQDPSKIDSVSYLIFYMTCGGAQTSFGLYLTKQQVSHSVNYRMDDDGTSVAGAWSCTSSGNCTQCGPKRNWFLGPVVGCNCNQCIFNTSGNGINASDIAAIIGILVSLL